MPKNASSAARAIWLLLVLLTPVGLTAGELPVEVKQCNGSAVLCDRRYDQVAYATTHNSMSNRHDHWLAPNQNYGITQQLNAGIRALMLDVHSFMGHPYLAHTSVLFGRKPLVAGLGEVRAFLENQPFEIVTIILENYVLPEVLDQAFTEAGLEPYLYAHQRGQPFPTLREMVLSGKRLVVFTDRGGGTYPWLHPVWDFCFDTPWKAKSPAELKNQAGRGDPRNPLLIVNHFLMNPLPSVRLATQVNQNPFLMNRIFTCAQEMRRMPNFINVDFYDIGDLFEVVDTLNGLPLAERRTSVKQPQARSLSPIRLWK
jgi:hypothetical protein